MHSSGSIGRTLTGYYLLVPQVSQSVTCTFYKKGRIRELYRPEDINF